MAASSSPAASPPVPIAENPPVAAKIPAPAEDQAQSTTAKFVGEDTCLTCHDAQKAKYVKSPHHAAGDPRTPAAKQSCETCHGAGSEHAEDPASKRLKNFKTMTPEAVNATCTTCHNKGEHALWEGSPHESRNLACTSCHSVHSYKTEKAQLKEKTQTEVCASCHRDKASKVDRSGHMPLREGKMQCTSCHNVHGTTNVKLLRKGDSVAELCTSCHADKRGPFLWEHAPSRDGCVTCHDPHGSSNERMLVAKPPILCQRCHVGTRHPSTVYDAATVGAGATPSVRIYGRTCVSCHSAIHGSNHPSGQRFIR
ncbi:MAG TPA: DmsE family decaheme c-type cytochrome [Vicinamibacterales bacterium]|nr:DmsE family decaheme c-type cytochrome [Vicinamibacterales bacterium]